MITPAIVKKLALSFPEVEELPHFHLASFRVNKKIFCTLHEKDKRVMVKLSLADQSVFCLAAPGIIFPVPGGWGQKGATFIDLVKINRSILKDAMAAAYSEIAPPGLSAKVKRK